jgi:5-methylcytosine-specific restriction endonuclease McrA
VTVRSCGGCARLIPATAKRCPSCERAHLAERRTQAKLYQSKEWIELRARKIARDGPNCQDCGWSGAKEVHHRFSVKDGHPLICPLDHLLLLCRRCHLNRESRATVPCDAPALGHSNTAKAAQRDAVQPERQWLVG